MSNYVIRLPETLMRKIINEGIGNLGEQLGATVSQVKAITSIPPVFELIMDTPESSGEEPEEPVVRHKGEISAEFVAIDDDMIEKFSRNGTLNDA